MAALVLVESSLEEVDEKDDDDDDDDTNALLLIDVIPAAVRAREGVVEFDDCVVGFTAAGVAAGVTGVTGLLLLRFSVRTGAQDSAPFGAGVVMSW